MEGLKGTQRQLVELKTLQQSYSDISLNTEEIKQTVNNLANKQVENAKEQTLLDKAEEIVTEVQKVNDAQEIIDQMIAIQLQTIIGDGD